jgi:hypothetical protein
MLGMAMQVRLCSPGALRPETGIIYIRSIAHAGGRFGRPGSATTGR